MRKHLTQIAITLTACERDAVLRDVRCIFDTTSDHVNNEHTDISICRQDQDA